MYARQTPRSSGAREINLPGNYGGTAFRHDVFPDEEAPPLNEECAEAEVEAAHAPDTHNDGRLAIPSISNRLFPKDGGIGLEELLLLGIILLISQNSENDDNISLLLLLLLFIR